MNVCNWGYSCLSDSTGFSDPDFRWQRGCLSVYVGSGACASAGQPRTKLKMIWCRVTPPQLCLLVYNPL